MRFYEFSKRRLRKAKSYTRECKTCHEWFKSETRFRAVCDKCDKRKGSNKWKCRKNV